MKLSSIATSFVTILIVALISVAVLWSFGVVSLNWPWQNFDLDVASSKTVVAPEAPARIYRVEPLALDCRARISAIVPVAGKKEHSLAGRVYRTDTVTMDAYGDVDTCVNAALVEIEERDDGTTKVTIPAEAIEFVRPRVDAIATRESVNFEKGLLGKITDAFPWVSDNEGLTPAAYAFAQTVVGGSECMSQAYTITEEVLLEAYAEHARVNGGNPDRVEVEIVGTPNFDQNPRLSELDGAEFEIRNGDITCEVADGATDQAGIVVAQ